ncbi:MAG TPA: L,D-transpeptidase family protein [Chryseosolibacter sp.]
MVKFCLPVLLVLTVVVSCTTTTKPPVASESIRPSSLPLELTSEDLVPLPLSARATVEAFYKLNEMNMIWVDSFSIQADGDSLIQFISRAESLGLIPDDYHIGKIKTLLQEKFDHEHAVQLDVLLTDSFVQLWYHLKNGRVDRKTFSRTKIDSLILGDAMDALKYSLANHNVLSVLRDREPKHPAYPVIKTVLEKYLSKNLQDTIIVRRRDQLIANLERLRWQSKTPERYISVNVPSYMLKVIEKDSVVLESRVIIGKPETPTPNIRSVVNSFIIYPYWHVPRSILKEILPSVQADTSYLRKHNYQVIDSKGKVIKNSMIDFKKYTAEDFPYVLRQREGSENTMGVIKFVFPNNYGVYLHDTNARRLFSKSDRALSHGCIRVQKAVDLAKYLAKDDDTYVDAADLEQYLVVQARMEVKIVKPIPVHLDYFTVQPQGDSVVFYKDFYKKDRAMVDSLNGVKPPHPIQLANAKLN